MNKNLLFVCIFSVCRMHVDGQSDSAHALSLLERGEGYLYKQGEEKSDLDSAELLIRQSMAICVSKHLDALYNECLYTLLRTFNERKDISAVIRVLPGIKAPWRWQALRFTAEYYLFKPGSEKSDMDSAMIYFRELKIITDTLRELEKRLRFLKDIGAWYYEQNMYTEGRNYFRQFRDLCRKEATPERRAIWFHEIGRYCQSFADSLFPEKDSCLQEAIELFKKLNKKDDEASALEALAFTQFANGRNEQSESNFLLALHIHQSTDHANVSELYFSLAEDNWAMGRLNKALDYALELLKWVENPANKATPDDIFNCYRIVAYAYEYLGKFPESLVWYFKSCECERQRHRAISSDLLDFTCTAMINTGKVQEAFAFLTSAVKQDSYDDLLAKMHISLSFGNCYHAMHQYNRAEKYYMESIKWSRLLNKEYQPTNLAYCAVILFYNEQKAFKKARELVKEVMKLPRGSSNLADFRDYEGVLASADSADGNYLSALQHFRKFKTLSDSIFNDKKSQQIEELQIRYETSKKEKDIQLLQSKSSLQQRELMGTAQERKFVYAGIGMLLVILGLGYNRYRLKQRSNRQLQEQQGIISQKNIHLEDLVHEKEWLLREIHHRVKNNLQIVISLLNTQSAFIDNEAALAAIRESRHRMQAMSMIHQKLYQDGDITLIDMQAYIREFVSYLEESFNASSRIRFETAVSPVELDVSQAIPIALILNEVITNALKHAFPGNAVGTIRILLQRKDGDEASNGGCELREDGCELREDSRELPEDGCELLLSISDNGSGWPKGRKHDASASFGMNLIDTLARQLEGDLSIINDGGVTVALRFRQELTSDMHSRA